MSRAALTLEVLAKQWHAGAVEALVICGHPHGRVPVPGSGSATQVERFFLCLHVKRAGRWDVVREAEASALRGRTWWRVDECLQALERRQVFPREVRLLPRGPVPADFPPLPIETRPTESARRKKKGPTPGAPQRPDPPPAPAGDGDAGGGPEAG